MENRQVLVALVAALAVYLTYMMVYNWLVPPPATPPAATQPVASQPPPASASASRGSGVPATGIADPGASFSRGASRELITLGGGPQDALRVEVTPLGAAVERILLTQLKGERFVHRADAVGNEPYVLVQPVHGENETVASLATRRIWAPGVLPESGESLSDFAWETVERSDHAVRLETTLLDSSGDPLLRISKRYQLQPGRPLLGVTLALENASPAELDVSVRQDAAFGIPHDDLQADMRRVLAAGRTSDGGLTFTGNAQRNSLKPGVEKSLGSSMGENPLLWTALTNRYFAVFLRPIAQSGETAQFAQSLMASLGVAHPVDPKIGGVLATLQTRMEKVAPGGALTYSFELYAGSKDPAELEAANPDFVDRAKLGYVAARDMDTQSCCPCQFAWLTELMAWLLESIRAVVRNYGLAIIILVIIVRTLLHPLSVFQQKAMYKSAEAMAKLQPKMAAIKEKHANDKVRMNQETMQLYADEGVNPAAGMIGMIPLFIQMPILIALWTALSTDVHLRHAPFDGWWIRDLSAPDALVKFDPPGLTIPILGWLIPMMFAHIPSLNLLPVLMGVSMWLQQKYMPKPHMAAKRDAAAQAASSGVRGPGGMTPEEQLRQQQMIANMMSVMFPLMFYYMPSGLNLYWMATNVFGIVESLIVRRQIEAEKARIAALPQVATPVKKPPGMFARLLQSMAKQAEELQKKADELSEADRKTGRRRDGESRDGRKKRD